MSGETDAESTSNGLFSRRREMVAFTFGVIVAVIVAITGSTEVAILFALTAIGARVDDVHLPTVKRAPIYALGGFVVGWMAIEVLLSLPIV